MLTCLGVIRAGSVPRVDRDGEIVLRPCRLFTPFFDIQLRDLAGLDAMTGASAPSNTHPEGSYETW